MAAHTGGRHETGITVAEAFPYRMAEVIKLSGASREAVRFYINAGLLPAPHRTARNMAWYSERHVEIIELIRVLQEEQFLPLKAIKALFDDDKDFEFTPRQRSIFASMREEMRNRASRRPPGPTSHAMAQALGLSDEDFDDLKQAGAIRADAERLTSDEEEILRQFAALRHSGMTAARGFSAQHLEIVEALADLLFDQELKLFRDLLADLRDDEIPALMTRAVPAINRIFAILHERKLRAFVARYAKQQQSEAARRKKAKDTDDRPALAKTAAKKRKNGAR